MKMQSFKERILYYLSSLYIKQLNRGTDYSKLYPAYSLVFTNFTVFPELKEYYSRFFLQVDKEGGPVFSRHLGIILVELSKFKAGLSELVESKDKWCYIIKNSRSIGSSELRVLSEKGGGMKEATERLRVLSEEESLQMIEEAREKNWRDERARRAYALEEGRKEGLKKGLQEGRQKGLQEGQQKGLQEGQQKGLQEGRQKGLQEGQQKGLQEGLQEGRQKGEQFAQKRIALNMLKKNMDISVISEITGLSKAEIKKLASFHS